MTTTYRPAEPIWCAGCGHFGVEASLVKALQVLRIEPERTLVVAGIGCSGTIQNNMGTYGYHALHGRVLPAATGVAYANPELTVIAAGGDGDGYAIGMGHLVHTFLRNPSFVYTVMNNGIYGLTKGQTSPTTQDGRGGVGLDIMTLGLGLPTTTFLARGFARWTEQLHRLTVAALTHAKERRGFAFLEVLSPCVTYNDTYPLWEASIADVDADPDYDPSDRAHAFAVATDLGRQGRMPVGLIYRDPAAAEAPAEVSPVTAGVELDANRARYEELLAGYRLGT